MGIVATLTSAGESKWDEVGEAEGSDVETEEIQKALWMASSEMLSIHDVAKRFDGRRDGGSRDKADKDSGSGTLPVMMQTKEGTGKAQAGMIESIVPCSSLDVGTMSVGQEHSNVDEGRTNSK